MTIEDFKNTLMTIEPVKNCSVAQTLELLSRKWTSRVIFELEKHQSVRFGKLKKNIEGITNTMLSSTLKKLEEEIITREVFDEMPVRVEYSLTEKGEVMLPIYFEMAKRGEKYLLKDPPSRRSAFKLLDKLEFLTYLLITFLFQLF